jgi:hypothetical protein
VFPKAKKPGQAGKEGMEVRLLIMELIRAKNFSFYVPFLFHFGMGKGNPKKKKAK